VAAAANEDAIIAARMRYAMFSTIDDNSPRLGAVHGDGMADVAKIVRRESSVRSLFALIEAGPDTWSAVARQIAEHLSSTPFHSVYPVTGVRWHAPIPRPRKNIVCLGLNYASHVQETTKPDRPMKIPDAPIFFTKAPTSVSGPNDPIPWDRRATEQLDYEAELGVIVGVSGKFIGRERALDHVFGYTVVNDVSARDLQFRHKQWFKGKSLDGFCPMGPVVVTADEFGDPQSKRITLRVNGETRQDANTRDMLFPVDAILECLSGGMTIEPGDIIATGTPDGVALGRTPPEYLRDGDLVETAVEQIGVMRNRVTLQR
jgi:2-keto-4-pentenoate hydratase/2-oxohepta-3-ene-1,7-dioic acid hydratase in catechol pathway